MRYVSKPDSVCDPEDDKAKPLTILDWWNTYIKPSMQWQSDAAWEDAFMRIDTLFATKVYPLEVENEDHEKVVQVHRGMDYGRPPGLPQGFHAGQMVTPMRKLARAWTSAPSEKPKDAEPAKVDGAATQPS